MLTELFCTISPTFIYLLFPNTTIPFIGLHISRLTTLGYCADGLTNAIVLWQTRHHANHVHPKSQQTWVVWIKPHVSSFYNIVFGVPR
jgi:hypothetical protein